MAQEEKCPAGNEDVLRNYQQEMIGRLHEAWKRYQSVMVQMPTGTGKTHLMAEVIREKMAHGVLIVAHRVELIEQISQTLDSFEVPHGFINRWTKDVDEVIRNNQVVVASIQTLSRRMEAGSHPTPNPSPERGGESKGSSFERGGESKGSSPERGGESKGSSFERGGEFGLVIIDEAHHALAKTYRVLWERWPEAKFLGLTATPCRMNNTGFLDLFQTLVHSHTIQEFIRMGWLSDFDYVTAEPDNPILRLVGSLKMRGADGDYQTKEMALVMDCEESVRSLYAAYVKFAYGKKGIVYAIDREHARHITEYYQRQKVNCCWIEAGTPAAERARLVQAYREGRIDVVVNVDILGEGADFPEVEFIQLARPTLSLSKYLQQVGRGLRIAEGKDRVVILDHVGMYQSFGLPTEDWDWQLMFEGRLAGKAGMGRQGLLYVRGDGHEKELASVQMVRIKQKDEEHRGLEIFIQNGRYGIALDGRILHQPLFEQVKRADDGYFAYCTYPYLVYKNRVTIIDKNGRDVGLKMYGTLEWEEESLLKGLDASGNIVYWDKKYGSYYHEKPVFEIIGGIEMARLKAGYVLRKFPSLVKPVKKQDIYYNQKIVWMNDWLISKQGPAREGNYSPQRILSYGYSFFYVKTDKADLPSVTIIDAYGNVVDRRWTVPNEDYHRTPVWRQTTLTNAYTRQEGFYDG